MNKWMDGWINKRLHLSAKGCLALKKLIVDTIYSPGDDEDITMQ